MNIENFEMERWQSKWEHKADFHIRMGLGE
jgi:hypothetical protein